MCIGCHSPDYNRTGPKHCGVFGQLAARQLGFQYSEALAVSQLRWDRKTLDQFLKNPAAMVPGTSMTFAGIADTNVRAQIIDYIKSLTVDHIDCR
jgi:cytochrome c